MAEPYGVLPSRDPATFSCMCKIHKLVPRMRDLNEGGSWCDLTRAYKCQREATVGMFGYASLDMSSLPRRGLKMHRFKK